MLLLTREDFPNVLESVHALPLVLDDLTVPGQGWGHVLGFGGTGKVICIRLVWKLNFSAVEKKEAMERQRLNNMRNQ